MSGQSRQITLWKLLGDPMPLSAGSPASLGASQANNAEQTTPATCGPSTTVLSATCVHGGYSERTCPVCCLQVPMQSSPIWRQRATPAGRSYWVLTTSARRTDASECSLSHNWPTPRAATPGSRPNGKGGKVLAEEVEIAEGIRQRNTLWPTPTLDCATERATRYAQGGLPLTTAVQMWPTPTSHPEDQTLDAWKRRAQMKAQNGINLHLKLGVAVQMWPTPCAHEARLGYQHRHPEARGSQVSLTTVALDAEGLAPTRGQPDQANSNTRGKSRARLNPRWVAQLMGFPADWLDGVEVPSAGSATR